MAESLRSTDASSRPAFYLLRNSFANYLGQVIVTDGLYYDDDLAESEAELIPFTDALETLQSKRLQTEAGAMLQGVMQGSTIIDLACGHPESSTLLRWVSNAYGAKEYVGVDINLPEPQTTSERYSSEEGFAISFQQADALTYLQDLHPAVGNRVFCFFGLEPMVKNDEKAASYADSCLA